MAQDDPPADEDKSTHWAEVRTDLAEDRNIMAMERTFAGWMRTAFAAIGIGLGFRALFGAWDPSWVPKLIASAFTGNLQKPRRSDPSGLFVCSRVVQA